MSENKTPSGSQGIRSTAQNPVTAIDIALEPDKTMIQHAQDANTGLLKYCQMTQLLKYLELIATYNEKDRAPVRGGHLV
jgi:hypothetical protein